MSEQTKRIDTFDIAKGIVILLVILGHMMRQTLIPSQWIFSFHMPFFFIVSGIFFNPQKYNSCIEYLTQKTRTLLIPSTLLTLLLCAITESLSLGYNIPKYLLIGERLPIVWFLFALFFTEIIYYFISKLVSPYRYIILLGALVIGYILHQHKIEFYYNAENLLTAVFFYGIGHSTLAIKDNKNNFYYENPTYKRYSRSFGTSIPFTTRILLQRKLRTLYECSSCSPDSFCIGCVFCLNFYYIPLVTH